jgi:hypothetical protein
MCQVSLLRLVPGTLLVLTLGGIVAVGGPPSTRPTALTGDAAVASTSTAAERAEPWTEHEYRTRQRLLEIAAEYVRYGRVDDEARWAPYLCRMELPSRARFSAAEDRHGHGQKLYFLFARDRAGYVNLDRPKSPVAPVYQVGREGDSQVIVKESWAPEVYEGERPPGLLRATAHDPLTGARSLFFGGSYYPYAEKGGKTYRAAKKAGLFVMFQAGGKTADAKSLDIDSAETDWLYGTLTADGKTVTAAGQIKSCMECHQQAPHGRLFGMAGKAAERATPTR